MQQSIVVSRGTYSDYRVLAVFEDEATAQAWVDAIGKEEAYDKPEIERLPYVEAGTKPKGFTTYFYSIELYDTGETSKASAHSATEWFGDSIYGPPSKRPRVRYVRAPVHKGKAGRLEVSGSTAVSVAKVASEKIAMWKAGAWGGPQYPEILEGGDK